MIFIMSIKYIYAVDPPPNAFYAPTKDSVSVGDIGNLASKDSFAVSLFTGAASYNYPIDVPKGTNDLQPSLSIIYNTQSNQRLGFIGSSWSITENYIQREISYSRNDTSDDKFKLILNGQSYDLVYDSTSKIYHTKIESFLNIQNVSGGNNTYNSYWVIKTKDGTNYRFGFNGDSEQVSNQENFVSRWYLDLINDTSNNKIFYSYKENPNFGDIGISYPYKISYNNDQLREIEFIFESTDRPDIWAYYEQGNLINMTRRLKEIYIKANNNLVRKYLTNYTYLDTRSFLSKIDIYGNDNATLLYSNSFFYYTPEKGWQSSGVWKSPYGLVGDIDSGVRFIDLNRDGYTDIVFAGNKGPDDIDPEQVTIRINNKSDGWTINNQNNFPFSITRTASYFICSQTNYQYGIDRGIWFAELNGDGFEDLMVSPHSNSADSIDLNLNNTAYLGYNNLSWFINKSFASPTGRGVFVRYTVDSDFCKYYYGMDGGVRLVDLNGDGLTDIIRDNPSTRWINNGSGWTQTFNWNFSEDFVYSGGRRPDASCEFQRRFDRGVRFSDINGDGLTDAIISRDSSFLPVVKKVLINNGKDFIEINWSIPEFFVADQLFGDPICYTRYGVDQGVRLVDVNGDGFIDMVKGSGNTKNVYLNKGTGWYLSNEWTLPVTFVDSLLQNQGIRLGDVNGDGFIDIIQSSTKTWLNNATKNYLLKNIITQLGGSVQIDYKKSSDINNTGSDSVSDLGFNVWIVSNITYDNGINGPNHISSITSYDYSGGVYDYNEKEFRGFGYVSENKTNLTINHYFNQDISRKGLEYKKEIYDNKNNTYQKIEFTWSFTQKNDYYINKLNTQTFYGYDGSISNSKVKNITYGYDDFGNTIVITNLGDINKQGDEKYEYYEYLNNSNIWIVDKPKHYSLYNFDNSTKLRESFFTYDDLNYNSPPIKGKLTNKEDFLNIGGQNPITNYSYDSFGNLIEEVDPNGNSIKYIYGIRDNTFTFADQIKNAKNQTKNFNYDLGTGNLFWEIDSNGFIKNYTYDVFGRISKEILPYDSLNYSTKEYKYEINGTAPTKIKVIQREINGTNNTLDAYQFYDGFGKLLQEKKEAENNQQIVTDTYYDENSRIKSISNPYFINFYENYSQPDQNIKRTNYTYDPLDRVVLIINPDDTKKIFNYNNWTINFLDENNHQKDYYLDAYHRIINVIEFNKGEAYNTSYTYDASDNLIQIKDSQNNTFNYIYDTLGRKIKLQDPDLGTWNYTYDKAGNLIKQTDNRNISINLVYDKLNRIISKNSSVENVTYAYDLFLNETLSKVQNTNNFTINYSYDNRLRKISEIKTIDGKSSTTNWAYDSMDRIILSILPDGKNITYGYNNQSKIKAITEVINNIDYNEVDKSIRRDYANSLSTNYTFNVSNFRLSRIKTNTIQDLNYLYDMIGNVKQINDTYSNSLYTMIYDQLDRLEYADKYDFVNQKFNFRENYTYNSVGNMLNLTSDAENLTFFYNKTIVHAPIKILSKKYGILINDTYKFSILNSSTNAVVAWFGDEGNIVLNGGCTAVDDCGIPPANSFVLRNSTGSVTSYVDNDGNLCIQVGDCSDKSPVCSPPSNSFIIKDASDTVVSYIDSTGDLCLTGTLSAQSIYVQH